VGWTVDNGKAVPAVFGNTYANTDIYYMTAGNTLRHTGVPRTLKACCAYFQ
jgi:hypothetical protein